MLTAFSYMLYVHLKLTIRLIVYEAINHLAHMLNHALEWVAWKEHRK